VRIAHYHRRLDLEAGGVVRAVIDLCGALAAAGHDVMLFTPDAKDAPLEWRGGAARGSSRARAPRVVEIAPPRLPGGLFTRGQARALAARLAEADVAHVHGMWLPSNAQFAAAAARAGRPYIVSVHGMLDDWSMAQRGAKKRFYLATFGRRLLRGAAAVHCTAQAEMDQARKWFPGRPGAVIPLIFDASAFASLPGPEPARAKFPALREPRPRLLFLSRLHYKKGVEHLLRAAAVLRARGRDVDALVAGTGDAAYEERLRALARDLRIEGRAHFLGFVGGKEKVSLYQAADLFVLPTSQENFGFVLFEAMAARTPVITTRGADTWPEVEASGGGVVVEASGEAIADAAAQLLDDPPGRRAMGRAGREWVLANLSAESVVHAFEELYGRVADRTPAAGAPRPRR
jgi:glycosyltransferase involved in cell wall biosynthesis